MALEHEALTERIIGAAIEVHGRLGPGFLESVYEKALIIELKKRGMAVQDQMEAIITYDGQGVKGHAVGIVRQQPGAATDVRAFRDCSDDERPGSDHRFGPAF